MKRAVLYPAAAVLYAAGWLAHKVLIGAWWVLAWCGAAVRIGWREAHSTHQKL